MSFSLLALHCTKKTSKSLLFQFILSEFISSQSEISTIHKLATTLKTNSNSKLELINSLKSSLVKLAGSAKSYKPLFSWNQEDGILFRLKNYCAHFSLQGENSNKTSLDMHLHINQAFLSCIQGLDTIRLLEEIEDTSQNMQGLDKILSRIIKQMGRFSKLTANLMRKYNDDENIVYFMLRHQTDLDKLYGSKFVLKLINRMYPKGIEEAANFLTTKYKTRGFDNLIPRLQKKISELKVTS